LAVALAGDPSRVSDLKLRLAANRFRARLFDTARHARTLEAGYRRMHERQVSGLAPADIVVE